MSSREHGILRTPSVASFRSNNSMLSSSTAASGGGGFTGFLSSLARTVSSASSSSQNNSQNKSVSPNTTFSAGVGDKSISDYDPAREPIKGYLRIRPAPENKTRVAQEPYIQVLDNTLVSLSSSADYNKNNDNSAPVYKFTRVFDSTTTQADFFCHTTLPMVEEVLQGSNALLFTYGVSNSGKTYTVQGTASDPGLLPRTFDVLFNSIRGKMSTCQFRPVGLSGVELIPPYERSQQSAVALGIDTGFQKAEGAESTSIPLGEHHQYAVWVSYAEVYNEKTFDLLDISLPTPSSSANSSFSGGGVSALGLGSKLLGGNTVKRKALSIKSDKNNKGKYISGLREVRVFSAQEARAVLRKGQQGRRVFSTLLNRSSSRSHGIFTIKIVRNLDGCETRDVRAASVSTLSIVDLAGSERISNTGTTGDRLREAGNINKSLMVLGQCMEVLRRNQEAKERNKKPAIVPFRHSKLTELFQSYFIGDGRVAMIVNVNPYDTGMEENSHVMKFASVARQVVTLKSEPPVQAGSRLPEAPPAPEASPKESTVGDVTVEEQDVDDEDAEEEEEDPLVTYLFDLVEEQRRQIYDLKLQSALTSVHNSENMHGAIEATLRENDAKWNRRLQDAIQRQEEKANAKIEILNQAHAAQMAAALEAQDSDVEDEPSSSDESLVARARD